MNSEVGGGKVAGETLVRPAAVASETGIVAGLANGSAIAEVPIGAVAGLIDSIIGAESICGAVQTFGRTSSKAALAGDIAQGAYLTRGVVVVPILAGALSIRVDGVESEGGSEVGTGRALGFCGTRAVQTRLVAGGADGVGGLVEVPLLAVAEVVVKQSEVSWLIAGETLVLFLA